MLDRVGPVDNDGGNRNTRGKRPSDHMSNTCIYKMSRDCYCYHFLFVFFVLLNNMIVLLYSAFVISSIYGVGQ